MRIALFTHLPAPGRACVCGRPHVSVCNVIELTDLHFFWSGSNKLRPMTHVARRQSRAGNAKNIRPSARSVNHFLWIINGYNGANKTIYIEPGGRKRSLWFSVAPGTGLTNIRAGGNYRDLN